MCRVSANKNVLSSRLNRMSTTPGNPGNLLEFNWSSWKFLCKMSLVSSHKNMDKYLLQKKQNLSPSDVFLQVPDATKPVFGRGSAPDPCWGAYDAPPDSYSAGGSWNTNVIMGISALRRRPKQGKHVLDFSLNPSWNLLEFCVIKFVDTLLNWVRQMSCCRSSAGRLVVLSRFFWSFWNIIQLSYLDCNSFSVMMMMTCYINTLKLPIQARSQIQAVGFFY